MKSASANIIWNRTERDKVVTEFHRILEEQKLKGVTRGAKNIAFENCQAVLEESRWKTLLSLKNYFYANKLIKEEPVTVIAESKATGSSEEVVITPGKPLPVVPVALSPTTPSESERKLITLEGNTLEEALANYVKQELANILAPVREATKQFQEGLSQQLETSKKIQEELNSQLGEIRKPDWAIKFFARSLKEEEQDLRPLAETPAAQAGITKHPLEHMVSIVGLLNAQVTSVENRYRHTKLCFRFVGRTTASQTLKSTQNTEHVLMFTPHGNISKVGKFLKGKLGNKVVNVSSLTDIYNYLDKVVSELSPKV